MSSRRLIFSCALTLALAFSANTVAAADVALRAGAYTDADDFFVGLEYRTPVSGRWHVAPNFELLFPDEGSSFAANADFHYLIAPQGRLRPWLGAGLGLYVRDHERSGSHTDVGLNLIGGLALRSELSPHVQLKVVLRGDTALAFAFGIRF